MRDLSIYLIVLMVILFVIMLQFNVFDLIRLVGTTANLGVVLVASVGLMTGKERGAGVGAVYGMMLDLIEGKCLGAFLSAYLLLGYLCGRVGQDFSKENRTTAVAMVGVGTVVFEGIILLLNILLFKIELTPIFWGMELAKEAVYNMFITIISFSFLYRLSDLLNRTKNNYYLL